MPKQCATGPQYGAMPDPWSPAVRKYINEGLDDETLGAPTEAQPPSSLEETVDGIKNGTSTGATLNMDGTTYQGVEGLAVGVNSVKPPLTAEELTTGKVEKFRQRFIAGHKPWEKIGIFKFPEDTKVSIDFSLVIPKNHLGFAKKLGTYTRQHSIYDFETKDLIELGFSGKDNRNLTPQELTVVREIIENLNQEPNSPKDIQEAETILDYIVRNDQHSLNTNIWRKIQSADSSQRKEAMQQDAKLLDAAILVREGKMTVPNFRKLVQKYNPIEPITEVPPLSSLLDVVRALDKGKAKGKRIVGLPNVLIKDGESVGFRLDIPAYRDYDIWVNAIHRKGQKNMYSNASVGINAVFGNNSKQALKVATGTAKSPFAVINVEWQNQSIEQTKQEIAEALQDSQQPNSTWKQIGMNPNRSGYFYDKATFLPVASASRVLQLGPLVMAQNVRYVPTEKASVNFSPSQPTSDGRVEAGEALRQDSLDLQQELGIPEIPEEEFAKRIHQNLGITLKGRYMQTLLDNLTDEGRKVVAEKGIPWQIEWHYDNSHRFAGYWAVDRDTVAVSFFSGPSNSTGLPIYKDAERTILHEHGHLIMSRLLRMEMVNNKKVRTRTEPGSSPGWKVESENLYQDITDFTPEFSEAFIEDAIALGIIFPEIKQRGYTAKNAIELAKKIARAQVDSEFYADILSNKRPRYSDTNADERFRGTLVAGELGKRDKLEKKLKEQLEIRNSARRTPPGSQFASQSARGAELRIARILNYAGKDYYSWFKKNIAPLDYVPDTVLPSVEVMKKKIKKFDAYQKKGLPILEKWKKREVLIKKYVQERKTDNKEINGINYTLNNLDGFYDIIDAMTNGQARDQYYLFGHGRSYYNQTKRELHWHGNLKLHETGANMFEAKYNIDQTAWNYMKIHIPNLVKAFDNMLAKYDGKMEFWNRKHEVVKQTYAKGVY